MRPFLVPSSATSNEKPIFSHPHSVQKPAVGRSPNPYQLNLHPWRAWAWLFVVNCAFTAVLQLGYVVGLCTGLHGLALAAFALAYVSQAGFLNLIPALITAWPLCHWPQRTVWRLLAGSVYGL